MEKIKQMGQPLSALTHVKPYRGILTGFNDAFVIDKHTKENLIQNHQDCKSIIKPYLRGQGIDRWNLVPEEEWIIILKSSANYKWPWSDQAERSESIFKESFPSIYKHFSPFINQLKKRSDQGKHWWELRACAYYDDFDKPKITYQVIQFLSQYSLDDLGRYGNDKTYFLPTNDLYLLGVLNTPLMWWHNWRFFGHMKDEALNPANFLMENLPIAPPTDEIREQTEPKVQRLIDLTKNNQQSCRDVLDWMQSRFEIDKLGQKLERFANLSEDEFLTELRKRIPKKGKTTDPLGVAGQKEVKKLYNDYALPMQTRNREILQLEHQVSDLVNQAYGLTPEDLDLMWRTAPPRMPIQRTTQPISDAIA